MNNRSIRSFIESTIRDIPGITVAVIGLSLSLFQLESNRLSSFQSVQFSTAMSIPSYVFAIVVMAALFVAFRRHPTLRIHRFMIVGFTVAGLVSVSMILLSGISFVPLSPLLELICSCVKRVGILLLLICWAEILLPLGARRFAVIFAFALIALGCLNGASSLFKQQGIMVLLAIIPFLSASCLYWFKDRTAAVDAGASSAPDRSSGRFTLDASLSPRTSTAASTALIFLVPLLCYPFVFGAIHNAWIPSQDGSTISLSIQLGAAVGTVCSGIMLLLLVHQFWGRRRIELYGLFVLPFLILALYLTDLTSNFESFIYIVPLNIVQKIVLWQVFMVPFLIDDKKSPLSTLALGMMLYEAGKALSVFVGGTFGRHEYTITAILIIMICVLCMIVGILIGRQGNGDFRKDESADSAPIKPDKTAEQVDETALACGAIAKEYRLTRREGEILYLLAKAMNAKSIAETLIVSPSTVKSHMNSIYAKLGVHTHSELLLLIHAHGENEGRPSDTAYR